MLLAHQHQTHIKQTLRARWSEQAVQEFHAELRKAYDASALTGLAAPYNASLAVVRDAGKALLRWINPDRDLLTFVEVCLIVHGAQGALNRYDDALYHARWASLVMQHTDPADYSTDAERFDYLRINALYAEIVAYRSLNLPRQASTQCDEITPMIRDATGNQQQFWRPHVFKDKIEALCSTARFALSEVEGLADQARAICEKRASPSDAQLLVMIDRALVNAYIRYGSHRSLKKADKILRKQLDQLDQIPGFGPLQRTMFLRTCARLYRVQGRLDDWEQTLKTILKIAQSADLKHQLSQVRQEYGMVIDRLMS